MSLPWRELLAVCPLALVLALAQPAGDDLDARGQATQALQVLDAYQHGNWLLPQARGTEPADTPPLYTWLAMTSSWAMGGVSAASCRVPSLIAALLLALLVFKIGRERWNAAVGILAAWILTASHSMLDSAAQIGPDMVSALLVASALLAVHRADRGHLQGAPGLFWWSVAMLVLSNGLLCPVLVLCAVGMLWISPARRPALRLLLFRRSACWLALPVAWSGLAYLVGGSPFVTETVLPRELALVRGGAALGAWTWRYVLELGPWSLVSLVALIRLRVSREHPEDRALALPCAFFATGLVLLDVLRAEREGVLLPLLAPGALAAAGVVLGQGLHAGSLRRRLGLGLACVGLALSASLMFGGARPAAARGGSDDLEEFTRHVLRERQPDERVRIAEGVSSAVFFYMGQNDTPLTFEEIEAYDRWTASEERALLICGEDEMQRLSQRWPGRFRPVLRSSRDRLLLIEDLAQRRPKRIAAMPASPSPALVPLPH